MERNDSFLLARAIRYTDGRRIVGLECSTCGRQWDVRNRGRETGFVAAAADNHAIKCKAEQIAANQTKEGAS